MNGPLKKWTTKGSLIAVLVLACSAGVTGVSSSVSSAAPAVGHIAHVAGGVKAVSYTHLDVYKRQHFALVSWLICGGAVTARVTIKLRPDLPVLSPMKEDSQVGSTSISARSEPLAFRQYNRRQSSICILAHK